MLRFVAAFAIFFTTIASARAQLKAEPGDWPAWRGPNRDGLSTETGLAHMWPKEGPKLLWKVNGMGDGYSTPSVAAGKIFLLGAKGEGKGKNEFLMALDQKDGKLLWETKVGQTAGGYPGPRSTPTVDGDRIYAISSSGPLVCVERDTGAIVWQKNLKTDFGGRSGGWAYAESPLIDGDRLICTPGGDQSTIVCLKKADGSLVWNGPIMLPGGGGKKGGNYATAGYSSVIIGNVDGVKQYIQFLSGGVVGVSADKGQFLWNYDHPANKTANISTPLFHDNAVLAASAYGTGGGLAKIGKGSDNNFEAKEAYFLPDLQNHHGGMIRVGDHVYGTGSGALYCIDWKTGNVAWKNKGVGKGSICYADGMIIHRSESGPVGLVQANPKEYVELGRFDQPDRSKERAWAHPIIAGGKLYLRDQDVLLCYDAK